MSVQVVQDEWDWSRIETLLRCPVCMDLPAGIIFQCEKGHNICSDCWPKMENSCPQCKCPYIGTRNFICEGFLENIESLKRIITLGYEAVQKNCTTCNTSSPETEKAYLKNEEAAQQSKGVFPCRIDDCSVSLPVARMYSHLKRKHSDRYFIVSSNGETFTRRWQIKFQKGWSHCEAVNVHKMNLFFFTIQIDDKGNIHFFAQMVGQAKSAEAYTANYRLFCPPSINDISETSTKVASCRTNLVEIINSKRALKVQATKLENPENFTCSVTIKYVGKPIVPLLSSSSNEIEEIHLNGLTVDLVDLVDFEDSSFIF